MNTSTNTPENDTIPYRHIARRSGELYLETAEILTKSLNIDLVTGIVFLTISRLNLVQFLRDQDLARKYAGLDQLPPDSSREPISVYSVARQIALPYETVRRHANKLVKLGLCSRVDGGGLIISRTFLESELAASMSERTLEIITAFVRNVGAVGLSFPSTGPRPTDVRHHVGRLNMKHFLTITEHLSKGMNLDLLAGLVLMAVITANTRQIRENQKLSLEFGMMDNVPPDSLRQPVSVYAIAKTLRLPYETTRRYIASLTEAGFCKRVPGGGIVAPSEAQLLPGFPAMMESNKLVVLSLLQDLAAVGISGASWPRPAAVF